MATQSLREALLALPGVAEADVDERDGSPAGVRVTLAPDADGRLVGAEVQRVLATHGLRSRITTGDELPVEVPAAEPEVGGGSPADDWAAEFPPPPEASPPAGPDPEAMSEIEVVPMAEVVPVAEVLPMEKSGVPFELASVSISEAADHLSVTAVADDGRSHTVEGAASEEGLLGAVVVAVGTLVWGVAPTVISVDAVPAAGSEVVTVVLEDGGGRRLAGAAVVVADRAYAAARATLAAIRCG